MVYLAIIHTLRHHVYDVNAKPVPVKNQTSLHCDVMSTSTGWRLWDRPRGYCQVIQQ